MAEKILFRISLIASVIGIILLFFVSSFVELDRKLISTIDSSDVGRNVKVMGIVSSVYDGNKTKTIMVEEPSAIKVILFKNKGYKDFALSSGDNIEVIGAVEDYNGQKEILAQRIRKIE